MIIVGWIVWGVACIVALTFLLAGITQRTQIFVTFI